MKLARRIEHCQEDLTVIQGGRHEDDVATMLSKYDDLVEILGEDHQMVLGVLQDVRQRQYVARTPVSQKLLDSLVHTGSGLLRVMDRDMLKLADTRGNFENNAVYGSMSRLRDSVARTIASYTRLAGSQ